MKKRMIIILLSIFAVIGLHLAACNKQTCDNWDVPPPSSFAFQIKENGSRLSDSILSQIKCYYFQGSTKKYIILHYSTTDLAECIANQGILIDNVDMIYASGNSGVRNFYIEFPNGSVDTLYLDVERVETCQAKKERCDCEFPIRSVKYNNNEATEHELSWLYGAPIFILKK